MAGHITINGRRIGAECPVYVVAELSANHNHSFDEAGALVHAAKEAGADAVKLQTYLPDTMTIDCDGEEFRIAGTLWQGRKLYDLYAEACTPWEWQPKLFQIAAELGLDAFSSPFDASAVDFLDEAGVPAFKIASFEIIDLALIRYAARTGKPLIISTGMASLAEIDEAVAAASGAGAGGIALLKCASAYPAAPSDMNLRTIPHLAAAYDLPVGLSDHTLGVAVPVAAVALGACLVEKHLTLSRERPGPDSAFSLEPGEFKTMVDSVRAAEQSVGQVRYGLSGREEESKALRRSLFVVRDIRAGEVFTPENVRSIRPGHGLHPRYLEKIIGRRAARDIALGTPLDWPLVGVAGD